MKGHDFYDKPDIEVLDIRAEAGFANSVNFGESEGGRTADDMDYNIWDEY